MTAMIDDRPDESERAAFAEAARSVLSEVWPAATAAESGDLESVSRAAREAGWFELGEYEAIEFLIDLARVLGEAACPLPVADAYVAITLLPDLAEDIAAGAIRIHLDFSPSGSASVPSRSGDATHVLRVDVAGRGATLHAVDDVTRSTALARPALYSLALGDTERSEPLDEQQASDALAIARLADAAGIAASAARAHDLAVEHARTREQFGRPIGAFGAVQQRVASCQIDVSASNALVDEAVAALASRAASRSLSSVLAARHVSDRAADVIAGSLHTLGAIGYFDEHEAAWLFRAVHAGLTLARARERALPGSVALAAQLLAPGASLPSFSLGAAADSLRSEVRSLLDAHRTADGFDTDGVRTAAADAGLFSLSWPAADGGRGASLEEQVVVGEEMKYAGGPVDRSMSAALLIGHSLLQHGSPEQKAEFLPLLRAGTMNFCLGYSEPGAGSDLASLRTSAVRDGDGWIVNGQKLWTTRANTASHVWLAVRTDADATPRHAGITIFLVPMDTPGILVQEHRALSGEISCTVFYDEVRVPDACRVGEVNGGWKVITDALAAERVLMGGIAATLLGHFDALLAWARVNTDSLDPAGLDALCRDAARLQAARALVIAATRAMAGTEARIVGPMAAVLSGDLAERFARTAIDLVGPDALLSDAPLGRFEALLRLAPMYVIGGGTNDIQRGIIARSLGLRRE